MHSDQVHIDEDLARRVIAAQFPALAARPVRAVPSDGTVNAIFRVGDELAARFPLREQHPDAARRWLESEAAAMTEFAEASALPAPLPVAIGAPHDEFRMPWAMQTWLPGTVATPTSLADAHDAAEELARLIRSLRAADTAGRGFEGSGRGGDLRTHDGWVDECLERSAGLLDVARAREYWRRARTLPRTAPDMMCHGDLIPFNLLADGGHLVGVLDAGGFSSADPALDLVGAWHLFDGPARGVLRDGTASDDLEWRRGAAWAFVQAMGLVWYYEATNPGMAALGRSTLGRILTADDL